ncbi:MAG: DUF58 domain-containing protein [Dehalococcoidia bacterium]|nr:DUF58 domain-containing protein [Dehalococcoidia bacterium]
MMGDAWFLVSILLFLGAAVLRQAPLLLIALLFLITGGVARLWARFVFERVEYRRHLSAARAFWGEEVTLEVGVANRKLLPMPWLQITEEVPRDVTFITSKVYPSDQPTRAILSQFLSLGAYHRRVRRYRFSCPRRGYFAFGPTRVRSGDLFGFFQKDMTFPDADHLLVYPKIVPLDNLGIPSKDPFGDLRVRRHLFQDPVRVVTTRDYAAGDPQRYIHWKASARTGRLQSKVFEPTTTVDFGLFLDVRTLKYPLWGVVEQRLEVGVLAAASLAKFAVDNGFRVGLYANQFYQHSNHLIKLPPSSHPDQFLQVLEALAHVSPYEMVSMSQLVEQEARSLPWGATLVVISAAPTEALLASMLRFRRAGRRVALVHVGDETPLPSLDGLTVYHVSDDVYWREMADVHLEPKV